MTKLAASEARKARRPATSFTTLDDPRDPEAAVPEITRLVLEHVRAHAPVYRRGLARDGGRAWSRSRSRSAGTAHRLSATQVAPVATAAHRALWTSFAGERWWAGVLWWNWAEPPDPAVADPSATRRAGRPPHGWSASCGQRAGERKSGGVRTADTGACRQ
ncbi:hypothetical protein ACL02T_25780 [Pseudonocardia sp. RS010]|uniref:hypothetical protein n=1 Tax=Pseudonocardia sp. RS010 TaxID=3385979 RepID=UPI0039A0EF07